MKLAIYSFEIPASIRTSRGNLNQRKGFYLVFEQEDKKVLSEVSPLPFWSKESLSKVHRELKNLQKNISMSLKNFSPSVLFGVESALYRLENFEEHEVPICSLYQNLESKIEQTTIKLKLASSSLEQAIEKCHFIKQNYPHVKVRLDMNESWSLTKALEFTKHFNPDSFEYLEEPIYDLQDLKKFVALTQFPIAFDEKLLRYSHEELFDCDQLKAIIVKPTLIGGLKACQKLVRTFCCPIIFSSCYETEIGLANIGLYSRLFSLEKTPIGMDTLRCLRPSAPSEM